MISKLTLTFVVILLLPGMIRPVLAAEPIPDEAKAFQPSLGIRFVFDSNTYDSSTNQIESWIGIVTPAILFSTAPGPATLCAALQR